MTYCFEPDDECCIDYDNDPDNWDDYLIEAPDDMSHEEWEAFLEEMMSTEDML